MKWVVGAIVVVSVAAVVRSRRKPKETRSYELGYQQHVADQDLQATVYYRRFKNDFAQSIADAGDGRFLYTFGNIGHGQSVGADLSANGKITPSLTYSLTASPYWNQIGGGSLLTGLGDRAVVSASGRAMLASSVLMVWALAISSGVNPSACRSTGSTA